jgi:hypothetical protein
MGTGADVKEAGADVTVDTAADTSREADVTVEAAVEGATVDANDSGSDVSSGDGDAGSTNADSGTADADAATTDADAEVDADAGVDADAEADADAQADADAEAGPNPIEQYAVQYAQAFCNGQLKCCAGYDAGAPFDLAGCITAWQTFGWETTLPGNPAAYSAGHLNFNEDAGAGCVSALQNFTCPDINGLVSASAYAAVTNACLGVLTGTIDAGSGGCVSSFECNNGYCDPTVDGGAGTGLCTALVGIGGTCTAPTNSLDEMCSQAGVYQPHAWCNMLGGGATGTCAAPLADTTTCYNSATNFWSDYGCTSLLCGDNGCGGTVTYTNGFCANWALDGGTD